MNATANRDVALLSNDQIDAIDGSGPSFTAALCGFVSTTVATTMVMFLLNSL
jgi:hypothetical protein